MKFKVWLETQIVSYSKKPIVNYLSPALAQKINNFHLPNWQSNDEFLNKLKYLIDNDGDEFVQSKPQDFEKSVIRIAMDVGHFQQQARFKKEREEDSPNLETHEDEYERCGVGDGFERVVCGTKVGFEKTGMPTFDITDIIHDKELDGYFGIHCGDADDWLDWLVDDGYCDGDIYVYHITIPEDEPFYRVDDKNSGGWAGEDASREVPSGQIIFSKLKIIPAQNIKLTQFIKEKDYWKERKRREQEY
jgi:hypothetical protein